MCKRVGQIILDNINNKDINYNMNRSTGDSLQFVMYDIYPYISFLNKYISLGTTLTNGNDIRVLPLYNGILFFCFCEICGERHMLYRKHCMASPLCRKGIGSEKMVAEGSKAYTDEHHQGPIPLFFFIETGIIVNTIGDM